MAWNDHLIKLPRSFYERPTLEVAPELLGKILIYESPQGTLAGQISEVEAYLGSEDPASHAFKGMTNRTEVMFGQPGLIYIYQIYGLHFCMNVVTERYGVAGAVLLRSLVPLEGIEIMKQNRGLSLSKTNPKGKGTAQNLSELVNGPAKICQALHLTKNENGLDLVKSRKIGIYKNDEPIAPFKTSSRIGISKATQNLWRFYLP